MLLGHHFGDKFATPNKSKLPQQSQTRKTSAQGRISSEGRTPNCTCKFSWEYLPNNQGWNFVIGQKDKTKE